LSKNLTPIGSRLEPRFLIDVFEVENVKLVGSDKLTLGKILGLPAAAGTESYSSSFVDLKNVFFTGIRVAGKIRVARKTV
jgi:hypothetical protein